MSTNRSNGACLCVFDTFPAGPALPVVAGLQTRQRWPRAPAFRSGASREPYVAAVFRPACGLMASASFALK